MEHMYENPDKEVCAIETANGTDNSSASYESLQISHGPAVNESGDSGSARRSCGWRFIVGFVAALIIVAVVVGLGVFFMSKSQGTSDAESREEEHLKKCRSSPCLNLAVCSDTNDGFLCSCLSGYQGELCETEINECASNPCDNGGSCLDKLDGYICECHQGYGGGQCQLNLDECSSNPCGNGGTCHDIVNGYMCKCQPGYGGATCEADIDECASNPCGLGGICYDKLNGYTCSCLDGSSGDKCDESAALCKEAWNITDPTRSICYKSGSKCDHRSGITQGAWHRFVGERGESLVIPEHFPETYKCDTYGTGWLSTPHPTGYKPEEGTICYHWPVNTCGKRTQIMTKRCDGFFIYKLYFTSECNYRICTASITNRGKDGIECL